MQPDRRGVFGSYGLAGPGTAGDDEVQTRRDRRLEEPGRLRGEGGQADHLVQGVRGQDELADVDRPADP